MSRFTDIFPRAAGLLFKDVISRGESGTVYLTFDDGPDPKMTPALLDILEAENCPATFFLSGRQAELHPTIVRRIFEAGHTVANHGYEHTSLFLASEGRALKDIKRAEAVIEEACGVRPSLFRPPYGKIGPGVLKACRSEGMKIVLWSLSPDDYRPTDPARLTDRIQARVNSRDIILLHDRGRGSASTLAALPEIIEGIRKKGLDLSAGLK